MNSKKDSDKPLLLDIGCGKNKLSRPGYKIIGIDIWENSDADLIIPANKLPFDNESVDVIHTRHFLEHFTYNETVDLTKNPDFDPFSPDNLNPPKQLQDDEIGF